MYSSDHWLKISKKKKKFSLKNVKKIFFFQKQEISAGNFFFDICRYFNLFDFKQMEYSYVHDASHIDYYLFFDAHLFFCQSICGIGFATLSSEKIFFLIFFFFFLFQILIFCYTKAVSVVLLTVLFATRIATESGEFAFTMVETVSRIANETGMSDKLKFLLDLEKVNEKMKNSAELINIWKTALYSNSSSIDVSSIASFILQKNTKIFEVDFLDTLNDLQKIYNFNSTVMDSLISFNYSDIFYHPIKFFSTYRNNISIGYSFFYFFLFFFIFFYFFLFYLIYLIFLLK